VRAARVSYDAAGRHPSTEGAFPAPKVPSSLWTGPEENLRVEEIGEVTYLRLARPEAEGEKDEDTPEDVSD
jgi:hypothetical protein